MWNETPCPKCKTISEWSEYFNYFYCEKCQEAFHAPERRIHERWEDQELLAKAIEYLVKLTDKQQEIIEDLKHRVAKIESKSNLNLRV